MYGIDKLKRKLAKEKIKNQINFLEKNYISLGTDNIALSSFVKNAYINSDRYIAEVNHRVWSLYDYAKDKDLKNIFLTITLPSEYHPKIQNKYKNPKFIDDSEHTPKAGALQLSKIFERLRHLRAYRNIDKEDKCYFRVYEPHKDGTPHLHSSIFVPSDKIDDVVNAFKKFFDTNFPNLQIKIETNINNPVAYLMKYVLKTFDDLRDDKDNITDLSLWYIVHGITRFYTSRTLVSLEIYRKLNGKYNLLQLTKMYGNNEVSVLLDTDTKEVVEVLDIDGFSVYEKRNIQKHFKACGRIKLTYRKKQKPLTCKFTDINGISYNIVDGKLTAPIVDVLPVSKYSDMELYKHFLKMDSIHMDFDIKHYGLVKNELIARDIIEDEYFDFNTEYEYGF